MKPCWLGGHVWRTEVIGIYLHIGTPNERMCNIIVCTRCLKARISYGSYPPRRNPGPPGKVPRPAEWPEPRETVNRGHVPPRPLPKAAERPESR